MKFSVAELSILLFVTLKSDSWSAGYFSEFCTFLLSYMVNNRKLLTETQFHLKYENQADKETTLSVISLSLLF